MPQKYDKNMRALSGYSTNPETVVRARAIREESREIRNSKKRRRQFLAEPEEIAMLDALETMPAADRLAAAEGLLIARMHRKRKIK
jgi:hypothetical protein